MLKKHRAVAILLNRTGEDNCDASLKRRVMGRKMVVAIPHGKLGFGPREQIFSGEFGSYRQKWGFVKTSGESGTTDGFGDQIS